MKSADEHFPLRAHRLLPAWRKSPFTDPPNSVSRLGIVELYGSIVLAVATAEAKRSLEVSQKNTKYAKLLAFIRDYWEGLKRRTGRLEHDASVLLFSGLPFPEDEQSHRPRSGRCARRV